MFAWASVCGHALIKPIVSAPLSHLSTAGEQTAGETQEGKRGTKKVRQRGKKRGGDSGDKGNTGGDIYQYGCVS